MVPRMEGDGYHFIHYYVLAFPAEREVPCASRREGEKFDAWDYSPLGIEDGKISTTKYF